MKKCQKGEGEISLILLVCLLATSSIGGCMYVAPKYSVYSAEMSGKAVLAEAESSRQVRVLEATARRDSAEYEAQAERIRAQGVADANGIVAEGLGGPEGYLRYLAIDAMREQAASQNNTTIYVATEAGIPITEASRFNKPGAPAQ